MIIINKGDHASVHTLVDPLQLTNVNPSTDITRRLRPLSPLTFASLGFSCASFAFALCNLTLSPLHTIPILVAFGLGTPFHIGTLFILWRLSYHHGAWLPKHDVGSKASRVIYVILLQSAWLASAILSGMVLADQWGMVGEFCRGTSIDAEGELICEGRAQVTFTVATICALIEVIILGIVVRFLLKWDVGISQNISQPTSALPPDEVDTMEPHFWKVSWTFASITFAIPPFIVAILNITKAPLMMYSIPTVVVYILITPYHFNMMLCWRITANNPYIPFEPLTTKECAGFASFNAILWLSSAVISIILLSTPNMLKNACATAPSPLKCLGKAQACFTLAAVSTFLQVLTLGFMVVKAGLKIRCRMRTCAQEQSVTHVEQLGNGEASGGVA